VVNMDNTNEWISQVINDHTLYYDEHDIRVAVHTNTQKGWVAEIIDGLQSDRFGDYPLLSFDGENSMRGVGDTIVEALNDLDSQCREDMS